MEYNVDGIAELNMSPDDTISVALLDRFIINDIHTEMSKILEQCDYGEGEYSMPSDLYVMNQLRKKISYLHVDHLTLHMLYVADTCEIKKY